MHQKLPKEIDPFRLAQNGLKLEGQIPQAELPRLMKSLHSSNGVVNVKLAFDTDEIGTPYMRGEFKTTVSIMCERCRQAMTLELNVDCLLALIIGERKIEGLAEQYDPWVLENSDPVLLSAVIEDELILALPLVPRHDEMCLPDEAWSSGDDDMEMDDDKPESPFAVLAKLKTKE